MQNLVGYFNNIALSLCKDMNMLKSFESCYGKGTYIVMALFLPRLQQVNVETGEQVGSNDPIEK